MSFPKFPEQSRFPHQWKSSPTHLNLLKHLWLQRGTLLPRMKMLSLGSTQLSLLIVSITKVKVCLAIRKINLILILILILILNLNLNLLPTYSTLLCDRNQFRYWYLSQLFFPKPNLFSIFFLKILIFLMFFHFLGM